METTGNHTPHVIHSIKEFFTEPHLGVFFFITLCMVIASALPPRTVSTQFFVLATELLIVPLMFLLMKASQKMFLLSFVPPALGLIISGIGLSLGNDLSTLALFAIIQFIITFFLVIGLVSVLLLDHEMNFRMIMGAASLYILVGLLFARLYFVMDATHFFSGPFFADAGRQIIASDFVYYSFVTMNTIGYGDITAATQVGRLISVLQATIGQLYLVVIIALVVGNFSANLDLRVKEAREKKREKKLEKAEHTREEHGHEISD